MRSPTHQQLIWQEAGFGIFLHFGLNTFHGKEWSDGTLDPATFDPLELDARQWVATAAEAGAGFVLLTAKHHDGFCLWQTDTTNYSVRSAPWRAGKGDVVAELAEACRAEGIGMGLDLSPWDRNAACFADEAAYNAFYLRQLTELCTRYGPLQEIRFDGAGSERRHYDWVSFMEVVDTHQPEALVFNLGRPDLRWIGTEDGLASDPCVYAVDNIIHSPYDEVPRQLGEVRYLPPECDVPIRRHWFWQPDDLHTLKSREHLLAVWYRTVGLGAGLVLNVPPDRRGLIDPADRVRLLEFTSELSRRFSSPYPFEEADDGTFTLAQPVAIDHLELREDLHRGQRIDGYEVIVDGQVIAAGRTVGARRVHTFPAVRSRELRLRLTGDGVLASASGFCTGHEALPELEAQQSMPSKMDLPRSWVAA